MVADWRLPTDWPAAGSLDCEILVSPLRRARQTAALLGLGEPAQDARLMEAAWGDWEGRRLVDLRADLGSAMAANEARGLDFQPPGGESPRDLQTRLRPFLRAVALGGRPTLAISHKGVIRALYALASGWDMRHKPPDKLSREAAQAFLLDRDGQPRVDRLNIPLRGPPQTP